VGDGHLGFGFVCVALAAGANLQSRSGTGTTVCRATPSRSARASCWRRSSWRPGA